MNENAMTNTKEGGEMREQRREKSMTDSQKGQKNKQERNTYYNTVQYA